tara:strand:+ start:84 stop:233 length:150 start_codon:yes stop_codon:yes gene_type:complete
MTENNVEMKACECCGKEVPAYNLDRYGECGPCKFKDRSTDMGVGDLNRK